jgi:molybdopterin-guanine dinucleotide biosynthesis protein A
MMIRRILNSRTLTTIAISTAVAIGSVAGVSLAQGNRAGSTTNTVAVRAAAPAQPGGILAGVHAILTRLVADGTIGRQQADAVQAQVDAGSIDPKQLVQSRVLSDAQMHAIGDRIDQLKEGHGS